MDTPEPQPANTEANSRKAAEAIAEVPRMKQEFIRCHNVLTTSTHRLVELLCEAETRGHLLEDVLTLVESTHWLQMIDWQTKFLSAVLGFTKAPGTKSLRSSQAFRQRRGAGESGRLRRELRRHCDAKCDSAGVRIRWPTAARNARTRGHHSGERGILGNGASFRNWPKVST